MAKGVFQSLAEKFGMPQKPEITMRRCLGCGESFIPNDAQQKYCTQRCKYKHNPRQKTNRNIPKVNYSAYIQSEDWKRKADAAKKRAGYRCQVCNRDTSQVLQLEAHHRTYENLGNERPEDITVLCNECHELFSKQKRG